jgi:hypothetical protein
LFGFVIMGLVYHFVRKTHDHLFVTGSHGEATAIVACTGPEVRPRAQ